jgi:hypothetical protein
MKRIVIATGVLFLSAAGLLLLGQAPALPGTSADRIGFPTNYKTTYKQLYALDNNQNQQVRVIWANDIAQTVDTSQPWNFPYGSILLFEDYPTVPDADGNPTLDANGRFMRGALRTIFAMKKDQGFGAEYGPIRNGEWEWCVLHARRSFRHGARRQRRLRPVPPARKRRRAFQQSAADQREERLRISRRTLFHRRQRRYPRRRDAELFVRTENHTRQGRRAPDYIQR